ncbi:MAG: IS1595 family transposase [Alphaproteobacteria bacterium]
MTDLSRAIYTDETAARAHLEALRWPNGPTCPHCGETEQIHRLEEGPHRSGLLYCRSCRGQFSVTVGTVFERSHIPLNKWVLATHLLCASKKGISAHQLHRMLGITYKTAWFMAHRIREAMKVEPTGPLGESGGPVESDETFIGGSNRNRHKQHRKNKPRTTVKDKTPVLSLVERNGEVRSFKIKGATVADVRGVLVKNVSRKAHLMTDRAVHYRKTGKEWANHSMVDHSREEYVRGDAHVNTLEGFFSLLKRGINGTFHHVSEQHLERYLAEFDFRYNARKITDDERAAKALKGIEGKRITYRRID